ncbi:serine hydrolase [Longispora sp. NPDC051575]|uniref:serine hydrolase n=1 Tax=Longispora sp. NPDC051575 TaxID=3154943 RepID=UPI00341F1632
MGTDASGLTALLEAEAARFTLQEPPDPTAPAGVVELETVRDGKPLGVGIHVKHLTTGEEASVRPDVVFETQSVIKVTVAVRAYQLADAGLLDLDERVRLTRSDIVGGSGFLRYLQPGAEVTVRDLVTMMLLASDNTATDLLLARVGGPDALNAWLADSGYAHTRFAQSVLDAARFPYVLADPGHAALTGAQAYALGHGDPGWAGMTPEWQRGIEDQIAALVARPLDEVRALAKERGLPTCFGQMTPREAVRLLESIERGTAASAAGCAEMLAALREQQLGERRLPGLLDEPVAHKTGDYPPFDANDIGVVYAASGPIAIAVFANDLAGDYQREEDRIGRIARVVVDHFEAADRA